MGSSFSFSGYVLNFYMKGSGDIEDARGHSWINTRI